MSKIYPTLSADQRAVMLQGEAYSVEKEAEYGVALTEEERAVLNESYVEKSIEVSKLDDQLKEIKDDITAKKKPLVEQNKSIMEQLRTGVKKMFGQLYLLDDQDEGMMRYYDEYGNLVRERPLRPSEKQTTIRQLNKAE